MSELEKERAIYSSSVDGWRNDHMGEFVLIKADKVIGFFQTLSEAFDKGSSLYGLEPFFVHQITPSERVDVTFFGARLLPT